MNEAVQSPQARHHPLRGVEIRQVTGHRLPTGLQGRLLRLFGASACHDDLVAQPAQEGRCGPPNAARAAGDQNPHGISTSG